MKKRIIIVLLIIVLGLLSYYKFAPMYAENSIYKSWRKNWGIDLPSTTTHTVFENTGSAAYRVSTYSKEEIERISKLPYWRNTEKNYISTIVSQYVELVKKLRGPNEEAAYVAMFNNDPVHYYDSSLLFEKRKNDGGYFIAILNPNDQRLYTLEVYF
ncbi:hypothetical protein [Paenibacillus ginsengarvi]|uniref:Uncharacterized protein n=1 Tax=Paenibacillus ginsengarvi TaxID=400777 RepID=A0A3B0B6J6_9BACL|nr:hypothetical protein [Paenibacillus ginsengarvi]RKN66107.1 hypothetical protein D7M11_31380 [Paenibacillus ginsengarvi]